MVLPSSTIDTRGRFAIVVSAAGALFQVLIYLIVYFGILSSSNTCCFQPLKNTTNSSVPSYDCLKEVAHTYKNLYMVQGTSTVTNYACLEELSILHSDMFQEGLGARTYFICSLLLTTLTLPLYLVHIQFIGHHDISLRIVAPFILMCLYLTWTFGVVVLRALAIDLTDALCSSTARKAVPFVQFLAVLLDLLVFFVSVVYFVHGRKEETRSYVSFKSPTLSRTNPKLSATPSHSITDDSNDDEDETVVTRTDA